MVKRQVMNPTPIELIKEATNIVEVLENYTGVTFKNANRLKLSVKCPFHDDRSESMTVYTDSNKCRCWAGCGNGKPMDVVDVLAEAHGINGKEAIKVLLRDYNLSNGNSFDFIVHEKIQTKRNNYLFNKEVNAALAYVTDVIVNTKVFIRQNILNLEDLEVFGNVYHGLDKWYQLECMLQSGDISTKKEAIVGVMAFRKDVL